MKLTCSNCGSINEIPDNWKGNTVICVKCKTSFVPGEKSEEPRDLRNQGRGEEDDIASPKTEESGNTLVGPKQEEMKTKRCPKCNELIQETASECKLCGADLSIPKAPLSFTFKEFAKAMGCLGLVLLIFLLMLGALNLCLGFGKFHLGHWEIGASIMKWSIIIGFISIKIALGIALVIFVIFVVMRLKKWLVPR